MLAFEETVGFSKVELKRTQLSFLDLVRCPPTEANMSKGPAHTRDWLMHPPCRNETTWRRRKKER